MRTAPIGPRKGISEMVSAADAPMKAGMSGVFSPSAESAVLGEVQSAHSSSKMPGSADLKVTLKECVRPGSRQPVMALKKKRTRSGCRCRGGGGAAAAALPSAPSAAGASASSCAGIRAHS